MSRTFKAHLKHLEGNLGWRIVDVPFDVKRAFGKGGTVPVKGTVNGFAFCTSLFPRKDGQHFLLVNKKMQKGADATSIGDLIEVKIEADTEKRTVGIPPLLKTVLTEDKDLLEYFKSFSYSMRKYFFDYISQPKTRETAKKRAEQIAEILMEMRDGEITPPPILEAEFAHNPKARLGWERMSVSHRRSHLWGISYYRNPDSRARRVQKAIDVMVQYAEKAKKKKSLG